MTPAPVPGTSSAARPGSVALGQPVGVLGGIGPAATVHFLRRLVELTDATSDQEHVRALVWQDTSVPDRTAAVLGTGPSPEPTLVADVVALERAGARFVAIPCNTAVVWISAMRAAVGIEVLDTVDETVAAASATVPVLRRLGVLATDGTLRAGTYARAATARGIELVLPSDDVQREVMAVIYDGVKAGNPVPRERFDTLVEHLLSRGADAVALGCTELSVLHGDLGVDDPRVVDSIDSLARTVIRMSGARSRVALTRVT
ncbi:MAG: aspartate/glutamate racemase family protein [Dermatophilaceae bacterium]